MHLRLGKKSQKLKVIAFKLTEDQIGRIKTLCDNGFYPSLSETVRIAITDYISYIIDYTNQNGTEFWSPEPDQKLIHFKQIKAVKVSACTKMPFELLKTIDSIIENNPQFNNRTNFIRLAVNRFLDSDFQIYSHWLNKSFKKYPEFTNTIAF